MDTSGCPFRPGFPPWAIRTWPRRGHWDIERRSTLASKTFDVFLSHNSKDKPAVRQVAEALRDRGIRVCLDEWELVPGQPWIRALESHLKNSRSIAVCFGQHGLGRWEQPEMEGALVESVRRGAPVIPVALPGAPANLELPLFLQTYTWMDLRAGLTPDRLELFIRGINRKKPRAREKTPPKQPSGPRLHNLPFVSLEDFFKGRTEELTQLGASRKATALIQRKAIHGLGGIGKTRLAVEYAWRFGDLYTAALFVRADSPDALRSGLASLAGPDLLNLPERTAKAEDEVAGAALRWLRENPGWLLILDNVDSPEAAYAVLEILPRLDKGHVLITSRRSTWPAGVLKQSLGTLSHHEATQFLLLRTEQERTRADDDVPQAQRLAKILGNLPLALEQAAAYIARHRMTFSEYLETWHRERERVLTWYDKDVMQYPASVAVTWQTTFLQLGPTAIAVLRLAAYLAPDPIPEEMFEEGKDILDEAINRVREEAGEEPITQTIGEALGDLGAYSMISLEGKTFTIHRLVQEVIRTRIPEERRRDWIELSSRLVDARGIVGHPNDVRTWPVWDALRPHIAEVIGHADEVGLSNPTSRLMNNLGQLLNAKGLYKEAEPLMRRALDIDQNAFGENHPRVAIDLNSLAVLLQATNRLSEAEPLMRRALEIDQNAFDENHPNVVRDLNNLAQLLQVTNRLSEAEPLMRRALEIDQNAFGENHTDVARDLNNLAQLLKATNRLSEAEPLMRRALDVAKTTFGEDHPKVATCLNNLAGLLDATNRLSEAEPLMRRALDIDQNAFGENHPDVAIDLNNLAHLLQDTNRLSEAEPLMRRALEIWERSLGPDHPWTGIARGNLEILLQEIAEQGEPPEPSPSET